MKIALGADSAGKPLLDVIAAHLKTRNGAHRHRSQRARLLRRHCRSRGVVNRCR